MAAAVAVAVALAAIAAARPTPVHAQVSFRPECRTFKGMSPGQCRQLNNLWLNTNTCLPVFGLTTTMKMQFWPYAWWVGTACPTPCARQAKKMRKDPRKYCRSLPGNPAPNYNDAGCKTKLDCESIRCRETCDKQKDCAWVGNDAMGVCKSNVYTICLSKAVCPLCFSESDVFSLSGDPCCSDGDFCAGCVVANPTKARKCTLAISQGGVPPAPAPPPPPPPPP